MTKLLYVRIRKARVWHLAEWQDAKEGGDPWCMWVYCNASGIWSEDTEKPDRVCKRCLGCARAAIEYLGAAIENADGGS